MTALKEIPFYTILQRHSPVPAKQLPRADWRGTWVLSYIPAVFHYCQGIVNRGHLPEAYPDRSAMTTPDVPFLFLIMNENEEDYQLLLEVSERLSHNSAPTASFHY